MTLSKLIFLFLDNPKMVECQRIPLHGSPLQRELWSLRLDAIHTDIVIIAKHGLQVCAHKAILAHKHPGMKAALTDDTDVVIAPDFNSEDILADLELMYLDQGLNDSPEFRVFSSNCQKEKVLSVVVTNVESSGHKIVRLSAINKKKRKLKLEEPKIKEPSPDMVDEPIVKFLCVKDDKNYKGCAIECPNCWKPFDSDSELLDHLGADHPSLTSCGECGSWILKSKMDRHLVVAHGISVTSKEPHVGPKRMRGKSVKKSRHKCHNCPRDFLSKERMMNHFLKRHARRFKCKQCPKDVKSFGTDEKLFIHVRETHFERDYNCDICEVVMPTYYYFKKHLLSHMVNGKNGTVICPYCYKDVTAKSNHADRYTSHMLTHVRPDYFPFQCSYCPMKLVSSSKLKEHENIEHTGDCSYICVYCERGFQTSARRAVHYRSCKKRNFL